MDNNKLSGILKLKNVNIYFETLGNGNPLALIPGLCGTCDSFGLITSELSKYFKLILIDNRGAGRTKSHKKIYTVSDMADDVNELAEHLNLDKINILGHSMGGFIAQEYALKYPQKTAKVILSNTYSVNSARNIELFGCFLKMLREGCSWESWHRIFSLWIFSEKFIENKLDYETNIKLSVNYPFHQTIDDFEEQLNACNSHDMTDRLKYISSDVLTVYGTKDILITPEESIQMGEKIKNNVFYAIKNSAHLPMFENADEYIRIIKNFINQ